MVSGIPSLLKFGLALIASPNDIPLGPVEAPWDAPDPLTSVRQLQSLVGMGFNVGHNSAGDLQALIQSAMGGIRKEVEQHMDYLNTEHVEHKRPPASAQDGSILEMFLCCPPGIQSFLS